MFVMMSSKLKWRSLAPGKMAEPAGSTAFFQGGASRPAPPWTPPGHENFLPHMTGGAAGVALNV